MHHPLPLAPQNITAQSLIIASRIYHTIDIQKRHLDTSHSIIPIQDYPTHVLLNNFSLSDPTFFYFSRNNNQKNSSPRTGPQDLLVTHYDCEKNEQKTLHNYAINQVTQCEFELQEIETTNIIATLYSNARATTLTGYKFTATFSEKKLHCSQTSNGNQNRLDYESFH